MGKGRRTRLPMELIQDPKHRHVSFSKRKKGLFAKCAALSSIFCGDVQVAAVVFSQLGKPFSFGHPSPDSVLRRFLSVQGGDDPTAATVNAGAGSSAQVGFWWESADVEHMGMEELLKFKSSLEELKNMVVNRVLELGVRGDDCEIHNGDSNSTDDGLNLDELLGVEHLDNAEFAEIDHLGNAGRFFDDLLDDDSGLNLDELLGVDNLGNAGFAEINNLGNAGFVNNLLGVKDLGYGGFSGGNGGLMEVFCDGLRGH